MASLRFHFDRSQTRQLIDHGATKSFTRCPFVLLSSLERWHWFKSLPNAIYISKKTLKDAGCV